MKKQIKKLSLNKRTITNLQPSEMAKKIGGQITTNCHGHSFNGNGCPGGGTQNGNTCPGHKTCYNCSL